MRHPVGADPAALPGRVDPIGRREKGGAGGTGGAGPPTLTPRDGPL